MKSEFLPSTWKNICGSSIPQLCGMGKSFMVCVSTMKTTKTLPLKKKHYTASNVGYTDGLQRAIRFCHSWLGA